LGCLLGALRGALRLLADQVACGHEICGIVLVHLLEGEGGRAREPREVFIELVVILEAQVGILQFHEDLGHLLRAEERVEHLVVVVPVELGGIHSTDSYLDALVVGGYCHIVVANRLVVVVVLVELVDSKVGYPREAAKRVEAHPIIEFWILKCEIYGNER